MVGFHGYDRVLRKFIVFCGFRIVRGIFGIFQTIYWAFNGTLQSLHESRRPENYDRCVQVMNVVAKYHFDVLKTIIRGDYILTHNRFESPQYIFDNDHVTLLTLEDQGAIFVESKPGQQLWRSEFNSFVRLAQVDHGLRLFFVPMPHFLKMAEKLGDPKETLVFLFNTARCGSTLFTQIMEMTDCCVALSEPDVFNKLTQWQRERGETEEVKKVTVASIRWLCRPYKSIQPDATVMKLCAPSVFSIRLLSELYPNSKHLFMYRGCEKNAKSIYRLAQELPLLKIAFSLGKYSDYFVELLLSGLGFYGKDFRVKVIDDIDLGIYVWAVMCREYVKLRKSGFKASAIRYEDLVENPEFATRAIVEYCGLPSSLTEKALRGLAVDSQRNSPISMTILRRHKDPDMTPGALKRGNEVMHDFGLPPINSDGIFEATITHEKK